MTIQLSTTLRDAMVSQYETIIGNAPVIHLYTGPLGANCAAADPTGEVAAITLPADWMTAPSNGTINLNGTWTGTGSGTGNAQSYRLKQGATCHEQGTVTVTGGGGDLTVDNVSVNPGQTVTITTWQRTQSGA